MFTVHWTAEAVGSNKGAMVSLPWIQQVGTHASNQCNICAAFYVDDQKSGMIKVSCDQKTGHALCQTE